MKSKILFLVCLGISLAAYSKTWTISNNGNAFTPVEITINVGDSVIFSIAGSHNAIEVSEATYNANGNTSLSGGFQLGFGGGILLPAQLPVGTHWYVCSPHASLGMKGIITVQNATNIGNNIANKDVSLFPNPATDLINVSGKLKGYSYSIIDPTGRQVLTGTINSERERIDIHQLPKGVYFLRIGSLGKNLKFMKE